MPPPGGITMMRSSWVGFSTRFKLHRIQHFHNKTENSIEHNKLEKKTESSVAHYNENETSVSRYEETYKKLDKLDFVTAAKILFTEPPKKNKFGLDWHIVQFVIVCLPSLAVYLVAQYARHKMKIMDAVSLSSMFNYVVSFAHMAYAIGFALQELGEKKNKEEEKKAKEEAETKALEEQAATKSREELMEMKKRLGNIEEAIQEIVLKTKKPSTNASTKT